MDKKPNKNNALNAIAIPVNHYVDLFETHLKYHLLRAISKAEIEKSVNSVGTFNTYVTNVVRFINQHSSSLLLTLAFKPSSVRALWSEIRDDNDVITAFLFSFSAEFRLALNDVEWDDLLVRLADAYNILPDEDTVNFKIVDNVITDRLYDREQIYKLLKANKWLVVMAMLPFIEEIV